MIEYISNNAGVIGLVFFFVFFIGVLVWTFRPNAKQHFEQQASIPLKDDVNE